MPTQVISLMSGRQQHRRLLRGAMKSRRAFLTDIMPSESHMITIAVFHRVFNPEDETHHLSDPCLIIYMSLNLSF